MVLTIFTSIGSAISFSLFFTLFSLRSAGPLEKLDERHHRRFQINGSSERRYLWAPQVEEREGREKNGAMGCSGGSGNGRILGGRRWE